MDLESRRELEVGRDTVNAIIGERSNGNRRIYTLT